MGREVSSAAAAASPSSQSATCQLCERSSVVRYEQNRVQYEQNRVVYKIEAQGRVYPVLFLNKIGLFVESTFWAPSLALFRGVEHRKNGLGCCTHTRRSGFRRQNAFWRRFADVRKRAPSRKKRYPILFRNHPGIPDFVNFP